MATVWYAAAWNLNQLIVLAPDDISLKERHKLAEAKLRKKTERTRFDSNVSAMKLRQTIGFIR